jgi:hypothetical protein
MTQQECRRRQQANEPDRGKCESFYGGPHKPVKTFSAWELPSNERRPYADDQTDDFVRAWLQPTSAGCNVMGLQ